MKVVDVFLSTVFEGVGDALLADSETSAEAISRTASTALPPTVIEKGMWDSSEAQILSILDDNDGRMYQQDIVLETGFSAGMISRHLSELEDDGHIVRLRKGRKKIIVDPELLHPVLTET